MNLADLSFESSTAESEFRKWLESKISAANAERNAAFSDNLTRPVHGNGDGRTVSEDEVKAAIAHTIRIYDAGLPEVLSRLEAVGHLHEDLVRFALGNWGMVVVGGFDKINAALFGQYGVWDSAAHISVKRLADAYFQSRLALLGQWLVKASAIVEAERSQLEESRALEWCRQRGGSRDAAWPDFRADFPGMPRKTFASFWQEAKQRKAGRPPLVI